MLANIGARDFYDIGLFVFALIIGWHFGELKGSEEEKDKKDGS